MVTVLVAYYIALDQNVLNADSDFFSFWAGGEITSRGGNPYDQLEWSHIHQDEHSNVLENPTYVYPLPTALVFVPLGLLSFQQAAFAWLVLSQWFILASILIWLHYGDIWKLGPFVLMGGVLFRPTIATIWSGQISSLLTILVSGTTYCWLRQRWFLGGLIAGLLVLKPTICLFLGATIIWLVLRRQWRGLWGIATTIGLLVVVSTWFQPTWLLEWAKIGLNKVTETWEYSYAPTIWGAALFFTHDWAGWKFVAGAISSISIIASLRIVCRALPQSQPLLLAGLVLPTALVATPYLWNYDHLMLLTPILIILAMLHNAKTPFAWQAILFVGIDLIGIGLFLLANQLGHDVWSILVPISVTALFGIAWKLDRRRPHALLCI